MNALAKALVFVFAMATVCLGFEGSVRPSVPSVDDEVTVMVTGTIGGGDNIIDMSWAMQDTTLTVSVAVEMCVGVCIESLQPVAVRVPVGRLGQGTYRLLTLQLMIDTVAGDTAVYGDTTWFLVAAAGIFPRVVGTYWRQVDEEFDTVSYWFTNGDTFSAVGVVWEDCCARLLGEVSYWDDTAMEVTLTDTSTLMCDCADRPTLVTIAIANMSPNWLRVVHSRWGGFGRDVVSESFAGFHYPGLAINLSAHDSPGFVLAVDSTWRRYEITSTLVGQPQFIRLGPNPVSPAPDTQQLYVDSVAFEATTLEGFGTYDSTAWTFVRHRDGSWLEFVAYVKEADPYLGILYGNSVSGSGQCSNYAWRPLSEPLHGADTARIQLSASLKNPGGSVAAVMQHRVARSGTPRIALSRGVLVCSGLAGGSTAALRVQDMSGRTALSRIVRSEGGLVRVVLDGGECLARGVYVVSVAQAGITATELIPVR